MEQEISEYREKNPNVKVLTLDGRESVQENCKKLLYAMGIVKGIIDEKDNQADINESFDNVNDERK